MIHTITVLTQMTKKPGPAPTGKGLLTGVRLHDDLLVPLDAAISDESDDPSRPEMIRRIVKDWLVGHGYLKAGEESDGNGCNR